MRYSPKRTSSKFLILVIVACSLSGVDGAEGDGSGRIGLFDDSPFLGIPMFDTSYFGLQYHTPIPSTLNDRQLTR